MTFKDPINNQFLIHTSAKVGSTSIRKWLFHLVTGEAWVPHRLAAAGDPNAQWHDTSDLFHWCHTHRVDYRSPVGIGREPGIFNVAIHRDPCDRLYSHYQALVDQGAQVPPLVNWLKAIHVFRQRDRMLEEHTRPQSATLGPDPMSYDLVLPLTHLHLLPTVLKAQFDRPFPAMGHENSHPLKHRSVEATMYAKAYCEHDVMVGWNGFLAKWPLPPDYQARQETPLG